MRIKTIILIALLTGAASAQDIEVSSYISSGQYSGGGSSTSFSQYLKVFLEPESFLYLGHNSTLYQNSQAFTDGTRQELINLGGLFKLDDENYLNAEYYRLSDNRSGSAYMIGTEFSHVFDEEFSAGLGLNTSSYPNYSVQQFIPRLVWRPESNLSLNSRIYVSHSGQWGTYLALVEKLQWSLSPQMEISLGAALGPTLNRIDNDTSTIYTQPQLQTGAILAGCAYRPDPDIKLQLNFERDYFQGYTVNYIGGGMGVRF
ncbi:hypothetical protein JST97_12360 [bacterium]|nr:hypothetical protein [bacterium]